MENYNTVNHISSEKLRVQALYRVSTEQHLDHNEKAEVDIPMQRIACHRYIEQQGWYLVYEDQAEGISGHKIRAAKRDKIQIIKDRAEKKQFDILLVFMFDRIADETPFLVEWLIKHNIQVWSVKEGERWLDTHTDKLTNYIYFGRLMEKVKRHRYEQRKERPK